MELELGIKKMTFWCAVLITLVCSLSCSFTSEKEKFTSCDQVVDHFIVVKGGLEKLRNIKTFKIVISAHEIKWSAVSYRKYPDKIFETYTYDGVESNVIYNGDTAVSIIANKINSISGVMLRNLKNDALIFPEIYRKEFGYKYEKLTIEKLHKKDYYKVNIKLPDNNVHYEYYDCETGLLYKMIDEFKTEIICDEYQEIDGILLLKSYRAINPNETITFEVKEVRLNPEIDNNQFEITNTATNKKHSAFGN